jgi:predicted outer membrane protein
MRPLASAAIFAAFLAAAIVCPAAPEDTRSIPTPILSSEISGADLTFFTQAARQTTVLIRLSDLAKTHAVTPEIQAIAATISADQTASAATLKALATRKQAPLSEEPEGQGKKLLQGLLKLKGARFDKSYLDALGDPQDHLDSVLKAGLTSKDPDIQSYAQSALQTLAQERARVRKLGL